MEREIIYCILLMLPYKDIVKARAVSALVFCLACSLTSSLPSTDLPVLERRCGAFFDA